MVEPLIVVKNLTKSYGGTAVVNNITFDVFEGEIFGLLGPNGAGKTTTLEMIEGLRRMNGGQVTVGGLDIKTQSKKVHKMLGVQLQSSAFWKEAKLDETLNLYATVYQIKVDTDELLRTVGLEDKKKSYFRKLSGGQKQRFAVAIGILNNPKILILDEPTTGLDPNARAAMWELIRDINKKHKTTIIMSTHYMEEAEELCERVCIMLKGEIIALDKPDVLIDKLLASGYTPRKKVKQASLEEVFINLTGQDYNVEGT